MLSTLLDFLNQGALSLLGLAGGFLLAHLFVALRQKSPSFRELFDTVAQGAATVVLAFDQTLVGDLKADAAAGKISPEQLKIGLREASHKALDALKTQAGPRILAALGKFLGEKVDDFLKTHLEAAVAARRALGKGTAAQIRKEVTLRFGKAAPAPTMPEPTASQTPTQPELPVVPQVA